MLAMVCARRWFTMSVEKRGSVSARRSSSKPSSRLADKTRSEPVSRSSDALKPSDAAASSWRWRKACASSDPAPSVSRPAIRSVMPACPAGSPAVPPENEKGERHHGRALVLDQPGLDAERGRDFLDLDRAGHGRQQNQETGQRGRKRAKRLHPPLAAGVKRAVTAPSSRQTSRAAARTSSRVTAEMRCGQASTSATVLPVLSAVP
jgi:hypothetical protein